MKTKPQGLLYIGHYYTKSVKPEKCAEVFPDPLIRARLYAKATAIPIGLRIASALDVVTRRDNQIQRRVKREIKTWAA